MIRKKDAQSALKSLAGVEKTAKKLLSDRKFAPAFRITLTQLLKDVKAARSFWEHGPSSAQARFPKRDGLQIGGGSRYLPGFVNLDLFPPADVIWDSRYGLPFEKNRFEFVFTEHFFEHIDFPVSAKKVLKEIHRVLKPKGALLLGVPDGGRAARAYAKGDKKVLSKLKSHYANRKPKIEVYGGLDLVNYLFRDQLENLKYNLHFWAYDAESLTKLIQSAGFKSVKTAKFDPRYCNPKRKSYTLYVKAVK